MGVRFNKSVIIAATGVGLVGIVSVIPTIAVANIDQPNNKMTGAVTTVELEIETLTASPDTSYAQSRERKIWLSEEHRAPVVTTTTTTTTTVATAPPPVPPVSSTELRCPQWQELAVAVGWPTDQLAMLDRVLYKESRCNIDSWNQSDPSGGSRGLMQINGYWCEINKYNPIGWLQEQGILQTCEDLFNPEINLRAGLAIYNYQVARYGYGWGPWGL